MGAQLAESLLQDKLVEADATAFEGQQELEAAHELLKEAQATPLVQLNIKVESPVAPVQHLAAPKVEATPVVQLVVQVQEAPKTQEVGAAAAVGGELKPSAVNAACQSSPESCSPDASLQGPQEEEAGPVVKTQPMDLTACVTDQQAEETGEVFKEDEALSVCPAALMTPLLLTPEAPEVPQLETQPLLRTISSLSSGSGSSRSSSNGGAGRPSSSGGGLSSEGSGLVLGSSDDEQGNMTAWGGEVSKDSHSSHQNGAVSSEDDCGDCDSEAFSELKQVIKQALKSKAERTRTWRIQSHYNKCTTESSTPADAAQFRVLADRVRVAADKCALPGGLPGGLQDKVQEVLAFASKLEELSGAAAERSSKTGSHSSTAQAVSSRGSVLKAAAMLGGSVSTSSSSSSVVLGATGRVVAKANSQPSKAKESVPAAVESPSPVQTPAAAQQCSSLSTAGPCTHEQEVLVPQDTYDSVVKEVLLLHQRHGEAAVKLQASDARVAALQEQVLLLLGRNRQLEEQRVCMRKGRRVVLMLLGRRVLPRTV